MKKTESGLSLIEMMVSITVAMLLSIVTLMLFSGQMRIFSQVAAKDSVEQEAQSASVVIEQLLRQAFVCQHADCTAQASIDLTYTGGNRNTDGPVLKKTGKTVQVDFQIPSGYSIWPNNISPFSNNFIRFAWNEQAGELTISNASSAGGHNAASTRTLLGNTKLVVTNFDLWPMSENFTPNPKTTCTVATACGTAAAVDGGCPCGGYELSITARSNKRDGSYTNPNDPNNALGLQHFRTVTLRSSVFPRN